MTRADLIALFLIGAVVGTTYDYIHVYFAVTAYERPDFAGTVLRIVPLQFGLCALIGGLALERLARRVSAPAVGPGRVALDLALLLAGYLATAAFVGRNALTFAALVPVVAASVLTRPTRFVLIVTLAGGVLGPLGEIALKHAGLFHYVHADPVPVWLPLLWMVASGGFLSVPLWLAQRRRTA